jgi:lipopolysaccharide export LptBFGC system permease protein LptF
MPHAFAPRIRALDRTRNAHAFLRFPVSLGYSGGILGEIGRFTLLILAGVEAIYLSDLLVFEFLPRVLAFQGNAVDVLELLVLATPQGLFLALPLALVIACYFVFLGRRESSEFTMLAGIGYSVRLLVGLALVLGAIGFLVSSLLTGFVEPLARYAGDVRMADIAATGIRTGLLPAGQVFHMGNVAVAASSGRLGDGKSGVFIQQGLAADRTRVVVADHTLGLTRAGSTAQLGLLLENATVIDFGLAARPQAASAQGATEAAPPPIQPLNYTRLNKVVVGLPEASVPTAAPRTSNPDEWTTAELLSSHDAGDLASVLGKRIMRGLLCFLVPIVALLAVAATRRATFLLVTPAAVAFVLAASFFGPTLIDWIAPLGTIPVIGISMAATIAITLTALRAIQWLEPGCIGRAGMRT